jgi:hypothetical protein
MNTSPAMRATNKWLQNWAHYSAVL